MAEDFESLRAAVLEFINAWDEHPPNYRLRRRKLSLLRHLIGAPGDPADPTPDGRRKP